MAGLGWEEGPRGREPEGGSGWAPTCLSVKLHDYIPLPTSPCLDVALSQWPPERGELAPAQEGSSRPLALPTAPSRCRASRPRSLGEGRTAQRMTLRPYLTPPEPRRTGPGKERGSHPGPTHHF